MKVGALVYAFDGDLLYTTIASECAKRVRKFLGLPTTLVTDCVPECKDEFDQVIIVDSPTETGVRAWVDCDAPVAWKNASRCTALELTPYDRTILLDADFWIESDALLSVINSAGDFYAHSDRRYINEPVKSVEYFGELRVPMWWATVCIFSKTDFTRDVFTTWKMIEANYIHYASMFNFKTRPFRNDYALSMSLLLANGNTMPMQCSIPWPLLNIPDSCNIEYSNNTWELSYEVYENEQFKSKRVITHNQDLHLMGKRNLEKICEISS